ncbi:sulfotransferase domain-containing protein [Salipiger pacificus]|nr:sulfotransferase domain-containing protein [Alloyangia pacifica]MCA0947984.1 sulfotransferase domain-containing protein [Alloyangia pacifica]
MMAPNLFILGAQKAGTTYLAKVLADHPKVFFSDPKETMFFSRKRELTKADYEDYCREFFGAASDQPWRAEGSTTYLQWQGARDKLHSFVEGTPRFIVCLRQPVAKAVSFFIHNWRRDRYAPDARLSDTLDFGVELSPLHTSLYANAISRWLEIYPRENFLFLKFDDLERDPATFVGKATDFLGISKAPNITSDQVNAGFPLVWEGDVLTIRSSSMTNRPRFEPSELELLQARFEPDLRKTEELTGLDLSNWYTLPQFAPETA